VHAWELYKLCMLNAGHSTMAYLCALAGITYVDEAMATPEVGDFFQRFLHDEALPPLTEIPGHSRESYIATLQDRFSNTGVRDQIARLCIDGTAKFPTFLVPTIASQLQTGGPVVRAALALAAWARYLGTVPEEEQAHDAHGTESRRLAREAVEDPAAFLGLGDVFTPEVASSERFRETFVAAYRTIAQEGPLAAMRGADGIART
jgi:mannitol 2-dehydrogenase